MHCEKLLQHLLVSIILLLPLTYSAITKSKAGGKETRKMWRQIGPVHTLDSEGSPLNKTVMLAVFDSLNRQMSGDPTSKYLRVDFQGLTRALSSLDKEDFLLKSQEAAWRGLLDYYRQGGGVGDAWGGNYTGYSEYNSTLLWVKDGGSLLVFEPCNFASSLMFYRVVEALYIYGPHWRMDRQWVRAVGQSSAAIAFGSSFFHASHTKLGYATDEVAIRLIIFLAYQALVSALPPHLVTRELVDLSPHPRQMTGLQASQVISDLYLQQPVSTWWNTLKSLDIPDRGTSTIALLHAVFSVILPSFLRDTLSSRLFEALPQDTAPFVTSVFVPQMEIAVSEVDLNFMESTDVVLNLVTVLKGLSSSLLYVEQLQLNSILKTLANPFLGLGQGLSSSVASLASSMSSLPSLDSMVEQAYPGESWCSSNQNHSKWHRNAATNIVDIVLLLDQIIGLIN